MDPYQEQVLPCGCFPSRFLCPVARRLWQAVGYAYQEALENNDWENYRQRRGAYKRHVRPSTPPMA